MRWSVLGLLGALFTIGCQGASPSGANMANQILTEGAAATKTNILDRIPIGTPIDNARKIMDEAGCDCMMDSDDSGDYLYCYKAETIELTYSRVWKVFFYYQDGKVYDVSVTTGLIGL